MMRYVVTAVLGAVMLGGTVMPLQSPAVEAGVSLAINVGTHRELFVDDFLVERLAGNDRELSVYATEAYYKGPGSRVRRFVFRTDGFVSVHAASEGELLTKPLHFTGKLLELNCRTTAGGSVRVEIQDAEGKPLPKCGLADCQPIVGDDIACRVKWKDGDSVIPLAGQTVRLRFALKDADLYSIQFLP